MAQSDLTNDSFNFVSSQELEIKKKIETKGTPLKEWDINIYRGLQTGNNDIFVIDETLKNKLINEDSKSKNIIKPLLQGKHINKYNYMFKEKYLLYITDEIDITKYTAIYKYLLENKTILDTKLEVKQGKMKWYCLYRPAKKHIKEFNKIKISWGDNPQQSSFCLLNNEYYVLAPAYILTGNNLRYLLAIMNTKISFYYLSFISPSLQGNAISLKLQFLEKLPIPEISEEEQEPFINLVDTILTAKEKIAKYNKHFESLNAVDKIEIKEEIEKLEIIVNDSIEQIDKMVYKLYELTDDEIKIVEGN